MRRHQALLGGVAAANVVGARAARLDVAPQRDKGITHSAVF